LLGQSWYGIGITANLGFDNILITGGTTTTTSTTTTSTTTTSTLTSTLTSTTSILTTSSSSSTTTTSTTSSTTTGFKGPNFPVLHRSDGGGIDDAPIEGWLDRIPDLSGNGNQLWSQSTPGVLDTFTSHTKFSGGPSGDYTMTWNGGTASMASTNDLQRNQFFWQADIRFTPNGRGAGQGGIESGNNVIFSTRSDEYREGFRVHANPDGSLTAQGFADTAFTTLAGLVTNDTWVNVAVSFEDVTDGGLTVNDPGNPTHVQGGRQLWNGTVKIYVNGVEEVSAAAQHVLNNDSFGPMLAQWTFNVGIAPNLAYDNILFKGGDLIPPDPLGTVMIIE
jgi:hypothetical protein